MILEVSIFSTEFVFIVIMIFAHWPRDRSRLDECHDADMENPTHLPGRESLIVKQFEFLIGRSFKKLRWSLLRFRQKRRKKKILHFRHP
jgi:hypothetical protein